MCVCSTLDLGLLHCRGVIHYSVAAECVVPGVFTCNLRGARDLTLFQRITFSPAQLTSTAHQVSSQGSKLHEAGNLGDSVFLFRKDSRIPGFWAIFRGGVGGRFCKFFGGISRGKVRLSAVFGRFWPEDRPKNFDAAGLFGRQEMLLSEELPILKSENKRNDVTRFDSLCL